MEYWLPLIFFGLMALSVLIYVVLDGYDLGVGILMRGVEDPLQDRMVSFASQNVPIDETMRSCSGPSTPRIRMPTPRS